jgi:transcriptional regulator with PAS, ATPase and Fis domain
MVKTTKHDLPHWPGVKVKYAEVWSVNNPFIERYDGILTKYKNMGKDKIKDAILSEINKVVKEDNLAPYYDLVVSHFLTAVWDYHDFEVAERALEAFKMVFAEDMGKRANKASEIPFAILSLCGLMDFRLFAQQKYEGYETLEKIYLKATSDYPLLIEGETGTSKSFMAKALHAISGRREGQFINLNCVGLPDTLLESELFGYEKGAFSGAKEKKIGLFEKANDGTVFLDEMGKTSEAFQTKLLKVIEERSFYRLGGLETIKINIRFLVSAQPSEIKNKKIIPDLLYRLRYPATIKMPSLRERMKADHSIVIFSSLNRVLAQMGMREEESEHECIDPSDLMNDEAYDILIAHEYSEGNYRELENILSEALISMKSEGRQKILPEDLYLITAETGGGTSSIPKEDNKHLRLRDIIDESKKVQAAFVEAKIRDFRKSGKKAKPVFVNEEGGTESGYQTWRNQVAGITGKNLRDF